MEKYIMVTFPEILEYMEHPRWDECIFCQSITGHEVPDSTYMVPEDLYTFVLSQKRKLKRISDCSSAKEFAEKHLGETFIYREYGDEDEGAFHGWTNLDALDILLRNSPSVYFYYVDIDDLEED